MAAYKSAGRVPLVIWAATVDPADVPMMRSASVTSTPASDRPAMRPSSHALPAAPPPARTNARLSELPALIRGVEEGVVFMGAAFRGLPVGRSQSRLPQSRDPALRGSTHYGYCVHGGLTSCRWITITGMIARPRRGAQSDECEFRAGQAVAQMPPSTGMIAPVTY